MCGVPDSKIVLGKMCLTVANVPDTLGRVSVRNDFCIQQGTYRCPQ